MALFHTLFGTPSNAAIAPKGQASARRERVGPSATAERAAQLLRSEKALIQLTPGEARKVVSYMEMRLCAEGEAVIRKGDSGNSGDDGFMALVVDGEVTVEGVMVSWVSPVEVNVLGPGNLLGEMSLMDGAARSATCTARTKVRFAVLTREALGALIHEDSTTAAQLLSAVALRLGHRLRQTDDKLQRYAQRMQTMQEEINRLVADPNNQAASL